jgi:hypothetical protein
MSDNHDINNERTAYDRLDSAGGDNSGSKKKRNIIIGAVAGVVVLAIILIIVFSVGGKSKPDHPHVDPVNPNDPQNH